MKRAALIGTSIVTVFFLSSCESMDPKLRAGFAAAACAGIVAAVDDSSDRARNAAAAAIACYIGAYLYLSSEERELAAKQSQELLDSDLTTEHSSTISFSESGKSVETRVGVGSTQQIDISSPEDGSNETEMVEVLCRPTTMESKNAEGQVIGTYEENFCRIEGDWYPENEARRLLAS